MSYEGFYSVRVSVVLLSFTMKITIVISKIRKFLIKFYNEKGKIKKKNFTENLQNILLNQSCITCICVSIY